MLKVSFGFTALVLTACIENPRVSSVSDRQPNLIEEIQRQSIRDQKAANSLDKRLNAVAEACSIDKIGVAQASCTVREQLRVVNEMNAPSWIKLTVADAGERRIFYAKEVEAGRISQEEASARYVIDAQRIQTERANNVQKIARNSNLTHGQNLSGNSQPYIRTTPQRTTTKCREWLDGIRCTTE